MNFSQLKRDICDEIESILACYWSESRLRSLHLVPGGRRPVTNAELFRGLQSKQRLSAPRIRHTNSIGKDAA